MNKILHHWQIIVPALVGLLLLGFVTVVGTITFRGCSMAITDRTEFQYDYDLSHAYESHAGRKLAVLQTGAVQDAQHHNGFLPPMQSSSAVLNAIKLYSKRDIVWNTFNPAAQAPFTPNATLPSRQISTLRDDAILFYDAAPPIGYRESYYVTIEGVVGHVPVGDLPKLLRASDAE